MDNGIKRVKRKQIVLQANEVAKERTKEEIPAQLVTHLLRKFERTVEYLKGLVTIDIQKQMKTRKQRDK